VLFDGVCNFCNGIVQFTIKRDPIGKFKFAPLQSESGQLLLKKFNLPTDDLDSFVLIIGDKCFLKSTAGLKLLKGLGGIWSLFYVFIIFPRPMRDVVYNMIAKTRFNVFGKRDSCMVPSPEIKSRFL
jgi:predicted DCC family thiol-disulfide oxidoreductase YuxK